MRATLTVMAAAALLSLTGCNCDGKPGTDGGTGGGSTGGGSGGSGGGSGSGQFTLTLNPATLTVGQGGLATVAVDVTRSGDTGSLSFALSGAPTGVTGAFLPNPTTSDQTTLTLTVTATAAQGSSTLTVTGTGATGARSASLPLTITAPIDVLLVDDDRSDNNKGVANPTASASDNLFRNLLTGGATPYNVYVVPDQANGPTFEQLKNYKTVIWYCASNYSGPGNVNTVSGTDEGVLRSFLDQGARKVIILSSSYFYAQQLGANWTTVTGPWITSYVGLVGYEWDKANNVAYDVTGLNALAGIAMSQAADTPLPTYTDPMNPAAGTDKLFTTPLDPDGNGVIAAAIAVGRKNVGTAATSTVVVFSFPFENLVDAAAPNTKAAVFARLLAY